MAWTQTNWQVITGAPCAGKTSVIESLASSGFQVVDEAARAYVNESLAAGLTIELIKAEIQEFETTILKRKQKAEAGLNPGQLVFLDRALPDSIAYFKLEGLDPSAAQAACSTFRYQNVFFFQRLPLRQDQVRREDEATAARLEQLLLEAYHSLGYAPIPVPPMSIEARAAFVLDKVRSSMVNGL